MGRALSVAGGVVRLDGGLGGERDEVKVSVAAGMSEQRWDGRGPSDSLCAEAIVYAYSRETSGTVVQRTRVGEIVEGTVPPSPAALGRRYRTVWGHERLSVRASLELRADLPSKCEASVPKYVSKECVVSVENLVFSASRVTGVSTMPLSIGVNLRVTGHCNQGGRKYMEDMFSVAFQPTPDDKDLEYAFFGIFDGHGGGEAATFAKEHLMDIIVKQKNFWSDRDEDVLRAIRDGYVNTHYAMWRELDKWPRTASGLPSTAGTTASIAFIRKGKIYIGHVGDSGIILGYQVDGEPQWRAKALTKDHKPESGPEMIRIQESGGKVVSKSGVPRVVWNRPRIGHKGPVRRSTHIDEIPFLAVARSLGDLWSYNSELNTFVVSPEPDVKVVEIDVKSHRCLIFGTDGLWNMLTPQGAVAIVQAADRHNEKHLIASQQTGSGTDMQMWINPSKSLVDRALERWSSTRLRADNTSVVTLMLDPPGPSRSEVLLSQKERVIMPNGVHTPNAVVHPETAQKSVTSNATPTVPRPVPIANFATFDPKQPDSSNEIGQTKENEPKMEDLPPVEESQQKNIDVCDVPENFIPLNDVPENITTESIQVAEVSSSEITEEVIEIESKESEAVVEKNEEKFSTDEKGTGVQDETTQESSSVHIRVQKISKQQQNPELKDTEPETKFSNMIRQNAFSGVCEDLKPPHLTNRIRQNGDIVPEANTFGDSENMVLNGPQNQQHPLFPSPREGIRDLKRRHSLSSQSQGALVDSGSSNSKTYITVNSRFKLRNTKTPPVTSDTVEDTLRSTQSRTNNSTIGNKRRHSAISQTAVTGIEESCIIQEPCMKRRTRSEDRPSPIDENDPANQTVEDPNSRLSWPTTESTIPRSTGGPSTVSVQERLSSPNTFQRRSLGKKATPVKTIRRPSINGTNRLQQLRGSFGLRDWDQGRNGRSTNCSDRRLSRTGSIIGSTENSTVPQRWLRSDTMAATPVRTLRSRNVDIAGHTISAQLVHQYGVVKQNRLSLPAKLKQSTNNGSLQTGRVRSSSLSSNKLKPTSNNGASVGSCSNISSANTGCTSGSGIAKRVKSPYNPSARSLSTRSRIKRLGK
ncbi:hypothetical protein KM043_012446 [Ampulex compressa]|nr:hypothetical protein KM043_012446 [Ampulex compressa]